MRLFLKVFLSLTMATFQSYAAFATDASEETAQRRCGDYVFTVPATLEKREPMAQEEENALYFYDSAEAFEKVNDTGFFMCLQKPVPGWSAGDNLSVANVKGRQHSINRTAHER